MTAVRVAGVSDEQVTIDANHPLAGQDLTLDLELVAIGPRRSEQRIPRGRAQLGMYSCVVAQYPPIEKPSNRIAACRRSSIG